MINLPFAVRPSNNGCLAASIPTGSSLITSGDMHFKVLAAVAIPMRK
jgi:hypothetical protein